MKKAALTFGLFSLVMVATSFATPETINFLTASDSIKIVPIDGGATGKQKKGDIIAYIDGGATGKQKKGDIIAYIDGGATGKQKKGDIVAYNNARQLTFAGVNQSIGTDKKVD